MVGKFLEFLLIERGTKIECIDHSIVLIHSMSCLPFYKVLKNYKSLGWNEEHKKAFIQLKDYLLSPSILTSPKVGETLFLYIATFEGVMETC